MVLPENISGGIRATTHIGAIAMSPVNMNVDLVLLSELISAHYE